MKTIRIHLAGFIFLLVLSGITAFPLQTEISFLYLHQGGLPPLFQQWVTDLFHIIMSTSPVMLYGTDWLAFAHIVISLFFIPVFLDPSKHKINLIIGMIACILIFPLAFICGPLRGIPFFHQLIDCSFGVIGSIYLYFILHKINQLKTQS